MSKFENILEIIDSEDEYILKTDIYEPIVNLLNDLEDLSLTTKDLLQKLLSINSYKLKYYLLDHPKLAYKLDNQSLNDYELMLLLKELINYEKRHL